MLQPIQPTKQLNARWIRFSDSMKYSFRTISGAVFFNSNHFFRLSLTLPSVVVAVFYKFNDKIKTEIELR